MLQWHLTHSRAGYSVAVYDIKPWAVAVEWAYGHACSLTRGWLGGHGLPDVFWRIPVGRPHYDRDPRWADERGRPLLENSVAMKLVDLESWMLTASDRHGRRLVGSPGIPISVDDARRINPKFVEDMEEPDDEA